MLKTININFFEQNIVLIYSEQEQIEKILQKKLPQYMTSLDIDKNVKYGGLAWAMNGRVFMWIDKTEDNLIYSIAHESVHAANFLLKALNIASTDEELLAYLAGDITDNAYKAIQKHIMEDKRHDRSKSKASSGGVQC